MKASLLGRLGVCLLALAGTSCSAAREGNGTSFLIVNQLEFARGATPNTFVSNLLSDVVTVVENSPTTFNDLARVTFSLGLKDPGTSGSPSTPTQNQFITVDRYHVRFFRTDGRNTQGVDVPFEFDGAFTITVSGGTVQAPFTVVRNIAKREAPLQALITNGLILSTIAEITFFGHDQAGHDVSATARSSIDFANFADE